MKSLAMLKGIQKRISLLRGQKVMLSTDLAELYGVEPRALVQAVKRNRERFPDDVMFQLNKTEFANLKSQLVTSSWKGLECAWQRAVAILGFALRVKRHCYRSPRPLRERGRVRGRSGASMVAAVPLV
jgi:hypothetical protein